MTAGGGLQTGGVRNKSQFIGSSVYDDGQTTEARWRGTKQEVTSLVSQRSISCERLDHRASLLLQEDLLSLSDLLLLSMSSGAAEEEKAHHTSGGMQRFTGFAWK